MLKVTSTRDIYPEMKSERYINLEVKLTIDINQKVMPVRDIRLEVMLVICW